MNNLLVILKKEVSDIFRDRKTILFTILLPILLYPAMFALMNFAITEMQNDVEKQIQIGIKDNNNLVIEQILANEKNIKLVTGEDLNEKLKKGNIQAIIEVPEYFDKDIKNEISTNIKIYSDVSSSKSQIATSTIKGLLEKYEELIIDTRLESKGLNQEILKPFTIENTDIGSDSQGFATIIVNLLPFFIIIFLLSPTISIAADLGAGEKERGTFEPLLSTSVNRMSILWGKLLSMCVVAIITLITSVVAMLLSLRFVFKASTEFNISSGGLLLCGFFCLLFLISICAINLSISIYARSMKEANSYLGGVIMAVMLLSYLPLMMDAKSIKFLYFNIPVVNTMSIMKEGLAGIYNIEHIAIVFVWNILYIAASIMFAKHMFSKEEVVFRS